MKTKNKPEKYQITYKSFEVKNNQYYTVEAIADLWELKTTCAVLRAIRRGKLPASKIGRSYRILGSDAKAFAREMRVYKYNKTV